LTRTCPGNKSSPAFHFMLDTMSIVCYYYMGPGEAPGATGRLRVPEIGGSEMGRNCKMTRDVDIIRDTLWVSVKSDKIDRIGVRMFYRRNETFGGAARSYWMMVCGYDMRGARSVGYASDAVRVDLGNVASRRSDKSDGIMADIAKSLIGDAVRKVAASLGVSDVDAAARDAVALAKANW